MLHQLELVGTALLTVLGGLLSIYFIFGGSYQYTPTDRDREGADEAMEKYAKRQRERQQADKDETTSGAPGPKRN